MSDETRDVLDRFRAARDLNRLLREHQCPECGGYGLVGYTTDKHGNWNKPVSCAPCEGTGLKRAA